MTMFLAAKWNQSTSSVDAPQLTGAKAFTFEELRKCTDNFSEANDVGGGGYGKVCVFTMASVETRNGISLIQINPNMMVK